MSLDAVDKKPYSCRQQFAILVFSSQHCAIRVQVGDSADDRRLQVVDQCIECMPLVRPGSTTRLVISMSQIKVMMGEGLKNVQDMESLGRLSAASSATNPRNRFLTSSCMTI